MKQLLAGLPEDAGERAARARRRALARLGTEEKRRVGWLVPALAAAMMLVLAVLWFRQAWHVETLALQPPAPVIAPVDLNPPPVVVVVQQRRRPVRRAPMPERLQVQLALSDGTQVYWTFDRNFKLGGTL
jgi:hypothetical protein